MDNSEWRLAIAIGAAIGATMSVVMSIIALSVPHGAVPCHCHCHPPTRTSSHSACCCSGRRTQRQQPPRIKKVGKGPGGKAVHPRVALGVCGSVAAVKTPALVKQLRHRGYYVDVIVTKSADFFLDVDYRGTTARVELDVLASELDATGEPCVVVWHDEDEWLGYACSHLHPKPLSQP